MYVGCRIHHSEVMSARMWNPLAISSRHKPSKTFKRRRLQFLGSDSNRPRINTVFRRNLNWAVRQRAENSRSPHRISAGSEFVGALWDLSRNSWHIDPSVSRVTCTFLADSFPQAMLHTLCSFSRG